jgi:hypothetical protein
MAASSPCTRAGEEAGNPGGEKSVLAANHAQPDLPAAPDACQCVGQTDSPLLAKIEQALRGPLKPNGFDVVDTPLEEVVAVLRADYDIPIMLDLPALEESGLGADEPVTTNLHHVTLRSALRLMLETLQLTYVVRDEVLMITTPEEAESELIVCVYDVRELAGEAGNRADELIETIVTCIAPESWAARGGGEADVRALQPGLLVVSQTHAIHEEIREFLATIGSMRHDRPAPAEAAVPAAADDDSLVTRSYIYQIAGAVDSGDVRAQVRDLVVQAIPDQRWNGRLDDGQSVVLVALPDRLVVRHKPSVQKDVEALLLESGVALPAEPPRIGRNLPGGGLGGGGGGFFQAQPTPHD